MRAIARQGDSRKMIGRARRKFTCRRALPIIFMSAADKVDLIHTQDYAKATLKVLAELFTKSDKNHRAKGQESD